MTTLAQDLSYQQARLEWREAMYECLAQCRRVSASSTEPRRDAPIVPNLQVMAYLLVQRCLSKQRLGKGEPMLRSQGTPIGSGLATRRIIARVFSRCLATPRMGSRTQKSLVIEAAYHALAYPYHFDPRSGSGNHLARAQAVVEHHPAQRAVLRRLPEGAAPTRIRRIAQVIERASTRRPGSSPTYSNCHACAPASLSSSGGPWTSERSLSIL